MHFSINNNYTSHFNPSTNTLIIVDSFDNHEFDVRLRSQSKTHFLGTIRVLNDSELNEKIVELITSHNFNLNNDSHQGYYENETLPIAYRLNDESVWQREDVSEFYPDITKYWNSKGVDDIRIMPCGPVDEDCLYLNGKWYSYCRKDFEWKRREDLTPEELPPTGLRREK